MDATTSNEFTYSRGYIFVVQQYDGTLVIGSAQEPVRRIAAINSGLNPNIKKSLTIKKIWGIKPVSEQRTYRSTVEKFQAEGFAVIPV
jgi:predicted GIY-YIG superfamily endonuclease